MMNLKIRVVKGPPKDLIGLHKRNNAIVECEEQNALLIQPKF